MRVLKTAALLEGSSLVALVFVAMPLKYWLSFALAVKIVGPIHGLLFLAFLGLLLFYAAKREISFLQFLLGFVASLLPTGTFFWSAFVLKK